MKTISYIAILMLLTACQKTLTEQPKSLSVENFYNSPAEVEAAVNAAYAPLRNVDGLGGTYLPQVESYVDYAYGRGSYGPLSEFQGLDPTNITRTQTMWNLFYLSIRNANLVIANAPNGENLSAEDIASYVAEARFIRALDYFFLVRHWGAVILRTEANAEEEAAPKSSPEAVYALIEEDLLFAEQNLPTNAAYAGKPSLWAAKTLLADVYFYQHKYAEAAAKAEEVITNGPYSLVPVSTADDFIDIYGPDVINTPEEIFYLKFSKLGNNQGWFTVMFFHIPGSDMHGNGGYYALYTSTDNPVYQSWDDRDLRKAYNWYSWDIGLGNTSLLSKKFIDPTAVGNNGASNDYPLYRYADLLLIHAEAAAHANGAPNAQAIESLNSVHRRAYGYNPAQASEVDFQLGDYDLASFLDLVLQERGYETQMEGKRWLDLNRTGKVREIIREATGKDIAERHFLWPIPVSEMNFNEALNPATDQNPGY
ncbi:RagB/SusD family nutrient uptake outer membrane protein [Olivibacter sp. SDN3]|uniref:RagB/SusD family nutrient uptake outer membrane protein n=1 Tax=Olivibacter sp. SDN3 TaxID=2764720 RepID=UPI0016519908|nr:RagB/SusD family nutrient uptake outer membrane protein [Olivibacter sp. SDN3]QNL47951.1 RagB/SusD family nutrient uptake outer membrane protein [Olivibacter sp. SDN3]